MTERFKRGDYSYGEIRIMSREGTVTVGKFCSIADNVRAMMIGHNPEWVTTYPFSSREKRGAWPGAIAIQGQPRFMGDIEIGNDVWIGCDVLLLGGITIGNGAVVGAGSVVASDVPNYCIVAGNPARAVRWRFTAHTIYKLRQIKWWDWPEEKILENLPLLCSPNVNEFVKLHFREA